MIETKIYNKEGKESGKMELPADIFGLPWNADLVHQVFTSLSSNARANNANTKDRSEVSGTGKKPWKQKGTGRATAWFTPFSDLGIRRCSARIEL